VDPTGNDRRLHRYRPLDPGVTARRPFSAGKRAGPPRDPSSVVSHSRSERAQPVSVATRLFISGRLILLRQRMRDNCPDIQVVPASRGRFALRTGPESS